MISIDEFRNVELRVATVKSAEPHPNADRLLVLHHGQQIAEGATDQVLSDPKVVEAYLGKRRQ